MPGRRGAVIMGTVTIELSHVSVTYKSGQVSAIQDVSLCVPQGTGGAQWAASYSEMIVAGMRPRSLTL